MIEPKWDVVAIVNAIFTRIVFAIHCCVSTWKCVDYYKNSVYYLILVGLVVMVAEGVYAIVVRKAKGYQWWVNSATVHPSNHGIAFPLYPYQILRL